MLVAEIKSSLPFHTNTSPSEETLSQDSSSCFTSFKASLHADQQKKV